MRIVVTTPTGNIGSVIVKRLLEAGADVSVLVRNPDRLSPEVRNQVTVHTGDLLDKDSVLRATEGAQALFWLTPPNYAASDWKVYYKDVAHIAGAVIHTNRIPYVVNLSSTGAHLTEGMGPVSLLQIVENALSATGANVLHLRPGYFYENFLEQVDAIRNAGNIFMPFQADTTFPMIATHDIAEAAARHLLAKDFSGVSFLGLHGPVPQLTIGEAAEAIGAGVGKPVRLITVTMEQAKEQFAQAGLAPSAVEAYGEMFTVMGNNFQPAEPRTPETTTPTTLRQWAEVVLRPLVG